MKPLFILGAGGQARDIAQIVRDVNRREPRWDFEGYVTHDPAEVGRILPFGAVVGTEEWLVQQHPGADVCLGLGWPRLKAAIADGLIRRGGRFGYPNIIHPAARLDTDVVSLGVGNVVAPGVVFSSSIVVGNHVLFNPGVIVGHDVQVGDYGVINPGASLSGNVVLGASVLVGAGATVLQGVSIGDEATLGAGALVTRSVPRGETWVGVPARPMIPKALAPTGAE